MRQPEFDKTKLIQAAEDLRTHAEITFAVYLDAQRGWKALEADLKKAKRANTQNGFTEAEALAVVMTYHVKGKDSKQHVLHRSSVAETLNRIEERGTNQAFLANMCAVSIFEFWETQSRNQLAAAFLGEREVVKSDLFGELRHLRHCILHRKGIADDKVAKCKTLSWFKEGDRIKFNGPRLHKVVEHIRTLSQMLEQFAESPTTRLNSNGAHVYVGPLDNEGNPICPGATMYAEAIARNR